MGNRQFLPRNIIKATIYYLPTAKGWGKEFCGRPTAMWDGKAKAEN